MQIAVDAGRIEGDLVLPPGARGVVLFAHGSGSSRHSVRNRFVAQVLNQARFGTLLIDLLTAAEDVDPRARFDIGLLTERLLAATRWLRTQPGTSALAVGYFGASTGAAAALNAAALAPGAAGLQQVACVVSRGGRPDLASAQALASVEAPTLLIVGGRDEVVIGLNREALALMRCERKLHIVPGATHLFPEPGALEQVATLAREWFATYLSPAAGPASAPAVRREGA